MRVSQRAINDVTVSNLGVSLQKMLQLQEKISTGRAISRPSDQPIDFNRSMGIRAVLEGNAQQQRNIEFAKSWLSSTDSAIQQATSILHRARELAVRGANDSMDPLARQQMAAEVRQLREQMRVVGNTDLGGRYLFAGSDQLETPYPTGGADLNNVEKLSFEVGMKVTMTYNVPGEQAFGNTGVDTGGNPVEPTNAFRLLDSLNTALMANDGPGIAATLGVFDTRLEKFLAAQAEVGAKVNRLDLLTDRLEDQRVNLQGLKSEAEDADIATLITDLNQQDAVYRASLAATQRVIQPTLLDYLR
ncbi:MAG: flagellar hook-associated protein FlgL [Candidatus Sericytochromatia bacterium]|nr:flagellar hook-associated protein FlgL [Candidatus Tanganyikabacteria bacterium]